MGALTSDPGRSVTSPVAPLRDLLEGGLTVSHVVGAPLWLLPPQERAEQAADSLASRAYDVAGLAEEPIRRYACREDLARHSGKVAGVASPILATDCVEKSLPLADLIGLLGRCQWLFVLDHDRVRWIVTRADLQAPAISLVVLAHLTALEAGLRRLVTTHHGDELAGVLTPRQEQSARRIFEEHQRRNVELGFAECLFLRDWLQIVGRSERFRSALGFGARNEFTTFTGSFATVRNDLAHGRSILTGCDPAKAVERFDRIRELTARVWHAAGESDPIWDVYAESVIRKRHPGRAVLAGPRATKAWTYETPVHVVTAWNPDSVPATALSNGTRNQQLEQLLVGQGHSTTPVTGTSLAGDWAEHSVLVEGLSRARAAEIGRQFGQRAIFELDDQQLRVIRCEDGAEIRSRPRVVA